MGIVGVEVVNAGFSAAAVYTIRFSKGWFTPRTKRELTKIGPVQCIDENAIIVTTTISPERLRLLVGRL